MSKNLENKARRLARKLGMLVHKSRKGISSDNNGGYMLCDISTRAVIWGSRFDLTAQDIIDFCISD